MKKVLVLGTVMAAVVAMSSPATAGTPNHDTDVTIDFVGDQYGGAFFGTVDSSKGRCFKDRQVKVKTTDAYGNTLVGSDTTNDDGEYAVVDESVAAADYRAIAKKKKIKNNKGKTVFVCNKGVSPVISAP